MIRNKRINEKLKFDNNSLLIFVIIFIGLFVIFSYGMGNVTAANPGDTIYVNSSGGSDSNNGSSWSSAKQSISSATGTVNTNGTINIANGQYTGAKNTGIIINNNMTIIGESQTNTIINGEQSGQSIFTIALGVNVTIINLTFTNNTAGNGGGGAIYNYGTLTINNSIFNNNNANIGGAICNEGTLTGTNDTFTNNTSLWVGGAILNIGTLTVTDSKLLNNTAIHSFGGAIYNYGIAHINFNWIVGNIASMGTQIYNDKKIDATNNWWGTNTPNTSGNDIVNNGGTCNYDPWIVLSINSTSTVKSGDSSTVTVDLTHDNHDSNTSGTGFIPNGIPIQFYDTLGNLIGMGTTVNGKTEINYTPNIYSGIATVNATANNANVSTNITVTNTNIYVSTTGNDTTGDGSQINPYKTIKQGMTLISQKGTLHIANGTYLENNIQITSDMTIKGENQQNTVINGNKSGNTIFTITSGINVTIINLTLTNGLVLESSAGVGYGGAIFNYGNLTINNSIFTNNTVNYGGGAIFNHGILTANNSTFIDNTADGYNGATGGAIYNEAGILNLNNCTFKYNNADGYGGAIGNGGTLNVNNSNFTNNTAYNDGGAIYNVRTLNVNNCTFTNNTADNYGGAILNVEFLNVNNSTFTDNQVLYGGAISNIVGTANVHFNYIFGNTASTGTQILNDHGTIDATDNWWGTNTPNTSGNDIVNNGGTCNYDPWIVLSINSTSPVKSGDSSTITADLTHDNHDNNTSSQGTIPDGILIQFYDTLGNVIGTGTTVNGKAQITYKPIIYSGIATVNTTANNANVSANITVTNANIYVSTTGNDTTGDGSKNSPYRTIKHGIELVSPKGALHIANGTYNENNIKTSNEMTITGENQKNTIIDAQEKGSIFGILSNGISFTIINLTIQNSNSANVGAIIYENVWGYDGILNITNVTFINNTSSSEGGAISLMNGNLYITNDTFINNTSTYGGAISNYQGSVTDLNDTFNNNSAYDDGGAIYNYGGTMTDINDTFNNNSAHVDGGAIWNYGTLTETNNKFNNNSAYDGGAIFNYAGTAYVNFNWIIGNTASTGTQILNDHGTIDATDNWWGTNTPNTSGNDIVNNGGTCNYDPWIILSINATSPINSGDSSTITADLTHDNHGNNTSGEGTIPDGLLVTFKTNLGTIDSASYIIAGSGQSKLISGVNAGAATVSETVDNQIVTTSVIIKDTIPPTVDITSPLNDTYVHGVVSIKVTATDNVGVTKVVFTINGKNYTDTDGTDGWNYNWNTIGFTDGVYNITVTAYDAANNSQNQTISINVDNTIPTATVNPRGGLYNTTKTVTLTNSEPGTIYYTIDRTTPTTTSKVYTTPIQLTSTTTLEYLTIDFAGNKSPIYTQTYTIDKTAPTVKANLKSGVYNANKVVSLSMSKIGSIFYTLNGSTSSNKSAKYTKPITLTSTTTLRFLGIDTAGNKSPIYTNKYIIEKTPQIISTIPSNQKTGFSRTEIISIKFNENIKKSTNWSKIQMKNLTQGKKVSITQYIKGNTLYIKMIFLRYTHNIYQITIPQATIQDNTGNKLQTNYTIKFKTGT